MPPVTLRPIEIRDWQRIHEWASTEAACRFQPWGPNSLADSEQFVADALVAWQQETIGDASGRRRQTDRGSWALASWR